MRSHIIIAVTSWLFMSNVYSVIVADANVTTVTPTTAPPTTTSTVAPITPNVTTAAPVTTVTPTTTTPTPQPTPLPGFDKHRYNLTRENLTCLSAEFALQFNLNGTIVNVTDAQVISSCPEHGNRNTTSLDMTLKFSKQGHEASLVFGRSLEDNSTFLSNVTLKVGGTNTSYFFNVTTFKAEGLKSYRCTALTSLPAVIDGKEHAEYTVNFKDVEISHPFHFVAGDEVNSEFVCPADDDMDDKIPLAVGAALIVLVLIVIISYYVGVRRSRRLTYQSV